ncbi:MAG: Maf family protein [Paracoccaceae bacterium]|nr:Maf family protein [Paracoccaceae bacterium]
MVLASGSPRRLQLLAQIGVTPDAVCPVAVPEEPAAGERPRDCARRLARDKARAVPPDPGDLVLAADTVVAAGRRILGKPSDASEARRMLQLLSGRRHRVLTGVALRSATRDWLRVVETVVTMKRISSAELDAFIQSEDWRDKAGGYAIQGLAAVLVKRINGSYSNVVGLPLAETAALLASAGYRILPEPAAARPRS